MPRWFYVLAIFTVGAPIVFLLHMPSLIIFLVSALGIIPLAALIGHAVEGVAEHTGEHVGGLLFATFGNATELIIGILALNKGLVDVVKASIIGSILGNILLVLGVAVCVGGFKHGRMRFDIRPASLYASLLALCVAGLSLPSIAELLAMKSHQPQVRGHAVLLSVFIAVLFLLGYLASILFSVFRFHDKSEEGEEEFDPVLGARSEAAIIRLLTYRHHVARSEVSGKNDVLQHIDGAVNAIIAHETAQGEEEASEANKQDGQGQKASFWKSLVCLMVAAIGVALLSEILVGAIEPVTTALGWNPTFVGLVFIPLIGGLPEYFNTISMALDKRMGMVLAASAGSSIQIALLVTPVLVLVSLFTPKPLDLVLSLVELAVLGIATFLFSEMTKDGELVWLEGLLLILLFTIMGGTIFLFG